MWNSVSVAVTAVAPPCAAGLEAAAEVGAAALVEADAVGELADVDEPEEEHPAASRVTVAAAPTALANVRPRRGRFLRRGSRSIGNENTTNPPCLYTSETVVLPCAGRSLHVTAARAVQPTARDLSHIVAAAHAPRLS